MGDFFSAVKEAVKKLMTTGMCTLLWFARIEIDQFIEVTFSKNSIFDPSIAGRLITGVSVCDLMEFFFFN